MNKALVLLIVVMFVACTRHQENRHASYQSRLHLLNKYNREDTIFHSTDEAQRMVDYFDNYGTPNERMLANYLLGRAYYDTNEIPTALKYYQEAIKSVDISDKECDLSQLSRVFYQMSQLFHYQFMFKEEIETLDKAKQYASLANDTTSILACISSYANAYDWMGNNDSVLYYSHLSFEAYTNKGFTNEAAQCLPISIPILLERGDLDLAQKYINIYESQSGFFDEYGNIEKGREIYYYNKGRYYLKVQQLDSAEFYFRKELKEGKDFNNQNAGSIGMALLYKQKQIPDSTAKYALYSYAMNDSICIRTSTEKVKTIQAMYDYSRNQEIAQQEMERASLLSTWFWRSISIFILLIFVASFLIEFERRKRKIAYYRYQKNRMDLTRLQSEVIQFKSQQIDFKALIEEREKHIAQLKIAIQEYEHKKESYKKSPKEIFMSSDDYKMLDSLAARGKVLTAEEMVWIEQLLCKYFPSFYEYIQAKKAILNMNEFNTCLLIRLYMKPNSVCNLLNISPSYVSKMRTDMLYKLFNLIDKPKRFDKIIQDELL